MKLFMMEKSFRCIFAQIVIMKVWLEQKNFIFVLVVE